MLLAFPSWTLSGCRTNQGCEDRGRALHRIPCRRLVGDQSRYVCGIRCKVRVFSFAVGSPGFYFLFSVSYFLLHLSSVYQYFLIAGQIFLLNGKIFPVQIKMIQKLPRQLVKVEGGIGRKIRGCHPVGVMFFDDIFY